MACPAFVIGVRCKACSAFVSPHELIGTELAGYLCWKCQERQNRALRIIATTPPRGCQACHVSFDTLADQTPGPQVKMFLHWKDGVLQLLCRACSDRYTPKRLDLYGDTAFGHLKKLKGAK